jgi:hypothetical protein
MTQSVLFMAVVGAAGWIVWWIVRRFHQHDRAILEERRALELAETRTADALAQPGALPGQALEVASSAAIEPRAEAEPCRICGGRVNVQEHAVMRFSGGAVRRVLVRCGGCGRATELFFRLRAGPN